MTKLLKNFRRDNKGVTMIEYALLASLIAVVSLPFVTSLGTAIGAQFQAIVTALNAA